MTTPIVEVDEELAAAVRGTAKLRTGFYLVVLLVALAGQVSGAVEGLHLAWYVALPGVAALELGGMVVLSNADVRRRLGERALGSRLLSAAIAVFAVAFNWLSHANHLLGGFYAGMSALGYLVWLMSAGNARRDRLRAKGDLPPTAPVYGWWRWLRRPAQTAQARALALAGGLDLYASLDAARRAREAEQEAARQRRRQAAISDVLRRKIAASADRATAEIAVTVFDLDEIAARLAAGADYDGLTRLIAADLDPGRLLATDEPVSGTPDTAPDGPARVPLSAHVPAVVLAQVRRALADVSTDTGADTEADAIPDTGADTMQVSGADTAPDIPADKPAPRKRTGTRTAGRTSGRTAKTDTATAVQRLRERHPEWQVADIARRLNVTDRTVRRHLNGSEPAAT